MDIILLILIVAVLFFDVDIIFAIIVYAVIQWFGGTPSYENLVKEFHNNQVKPVNEKVVTVDPIHYEATTQCIDGIFYKIVDGSTVKQYTTEVKLVDDSFKEFKVPKQCEDK